MNLKLKSIKIKNLKLKFNPYFNVIFGENGVGKTRILRSICENVDDVSLEFNNRPKNIKLLNDCTINPQSDLSFIYEILKKFKTTCFNPCRNDELTNAEKKILTIFYCIAHDVNTEIFLIDDIEMFLSPRLQITLCKCLKEFYPSKQFIITSKSPFIFSRLNRDEIIFLESKNGELFQKDVDCAKGLSVNDVISKYFDVSIFDEDFLNDLQKVENNLSENTVNDLKTKYGDIPIINSLLLKKSLE